MTTIVMIEMGSKLTSSVDLNTHRPMVQDTRLWKTLLGLALVESVHAALMITFPKAQIDLEASRARPARGIGIRCLRPGPVLVDCSRNDLWTSLYLYLPARNLPTGPHTSRTLWSTSINTSSRPVRGLH